MDSSAKLQWHKSINQIINQALKLPQSLMFAAVTWNKLYDPFVPMNTGMLAHDDLRYEVKEYTATITHTAPYAHKMYYGTNVNFRHEKHPLATHHWDGAAKSAGKKADLIKSFQAYIDK